MTNVVQVNIGKSVGTLAVDFDALKAMQHVSDYIWAYGIKQMLSDVHAGITEKTEPDATKRVATKRALSEKKLASLLKGEIAQERVGAGLDEIGREMVKIAETAILGKLSGIGKKRKDIADATWTDFVKKQMAANEAGYRAKAEKIVAARKADLESAEVGIDIMALLTPASETPTEEPETKDESAPE